MYSGFIGADLVIEAYGDNIIGNHHGFFQGEIFPVIGICPVIGGAIGLALALSKYPRNQRARTALQLVDIITPGLILAQAIGRFGNFINQEAFGRPTSLPWGLFIDLAHRPIGYAQFDFFHPTFLYEALGDIAIFILLWWLSMGKKSAPLGVVSGWYFLLYGILRFFVEGVRLDSLLFGSSRVAQWMSLLFVGIGVALLLNAFRQRNAEKKNAPSV